MLNRIMPKLPQKFVNTYRARSPLASHFRQVRCEDVACPNQERGFRIIVDPESHAGQRQAHLIRTSGRRFLIQRRADGLLDYVFPAGQQCFHVHRVTIDRPAILIVQRGDWRTPRAMRQPRILGGSEWLDRFTENQLSVAEAKARG